MILAIAPACRRQDPELKARLLQNVLDRDVPAMRRHAWKTWGTITHESTGGIPRWGRWESARSVLHREQGPKFEMLQVPLLPPAPDAVIKDKECKDPVYVTLLADVLYNQEAAQFIRDEKLGSLAAHRNRVSLFTPQTPISERRIPGFPTDAIAIKTIWAIVRKAGSTELPIWDSTMIGDPCIMGEQYGYHPEYWTRRIRVAPDSGLARRESGGHQTVHSVKEFYDIELSTPDLVSWANEIRMREEYAPSEIGDYAVLVGMHVATKEIDDWTWQTFWWHDSPDEGEFAEERPEATMIKGRWRNYLMAVAFDSEIPLTSRGPNSLYGNPSICYNPWLEAPFVRGVQSNCLACHQRANWAENSLDPINPNDVSRGKWKRDHPRFSDKLQLDYMWSLSRPGLP